MIVSAILNSLKRMKYYREGMNFLNRHLYREAIQKFNYIIKNTTSPQSIHVKLARFFGAQAQYNLGLLHFAMGNYSRAINGFEESLALNPDQLHIYEYMGICYNNVGNFDQAVHAFRKLLSKEPSHLPPKIRLSIVFHNLGLWDKAATLCEELLKSFPHYANIHFYQGLSFLGLGNASSAICAFENALKINPHYRDAQIRLALSHAFIQNYYDAFFHLALVSENYPDYADIYYFLGIICAGEGNLAEAVNYLKQALTKNPRFTNAKIKLGLIYYRLGQKDDAIQFFQESLADDPDNHLLSKLIDYIPHSAQNEQLPEWAPDDQHVISQAILEFNQHIEINPNFSEMISIARAFPGEDIFVYESIIPVVKESMTQTHNYPDSYCSLGALYYKIQRYDEAEPLFQKALALNPDYDQARLYLMKTLEKQNKFASALEQGRVLLDKKMTYPDFFCSLGVIYLGLNQPDQAEAVIQAALNVNAEYAEARLIMAKVRLIQENSNQAIIELQKCLALSPSLWIEREAEKMLLRIKNLIA